MLFTIFTEIRFLPNSCAERVLFVRLLLHGVELVARVMLVRVELKVDSCWETIFVHGHTFKVMCAIDSDSNLCISGCPLSLIHISEPTRLGMISYAVFCLKK